MDRLLWVDDRGQALVLDVDALKRILSDIAALSDRYCYRLADMANAIDCDTTLFDRGISEAGQRPGRRGNVSAGQYFDNARKRRSGARVDRLDLRVRPRAAQHRSVQHVG